MNKKAAALSALRVVQKTAWVLFLLFLPVTSFPYFPPAVGGGALVRPLSLYPLLVLLILVVIPRLFSRPAPRTLYALLPFLIVSLASSLLALLSGTEGIMGVSIVERLIRGLVTLGVGASVYFAVTLYPTSLEDLRSTLRWIYAGFSIALLWGSLQAVYIIKFSPAYFHLLANLQKYISTRRLITTRISGLTYEPNWFAEQISFLLLPWLLAAVLSNYTVFHWRWRRVTIEWFLLAWAIVVLAFTYSRAGLGVLICLAFVSLLFFGSSQSHAASPRRRSTPAWTRRILEAGLVVAILGSFVYLAGVNNVFFARIWSYWSDIKNTSLSGYFEYLGFGARFTYSTTAFRVYNEHPVFGVGLGNYAFYFSDFLPNRLLAETPEVLRLLTPDVGRNRLITPKNLYFRLLSETGLVGMGAFLAFLVAVLGCAVYLWLSPRSELKYWGAAGLLGLIAFSLAAFSFDSFAIPNMWVVFGLITSAAWRLSKTEQEESEWSSVS